MLTKFLWAVCSGSYGHVDRYASHQMTDENESVEKGEHKTETKTNLK